MNNLISMKVRGDFALFTRPENKAEPVSYPVMTPSAARGVLEAVFWKPQVRYRVREIRVLKPIQYYSILRNEVKVFATEKRNGFYIDDSKNRTQRLSMLLRDVEYVIVAEVLLTDTATEGLEKYIPMFNRRLSKGQCYHQPWLGCREFSAVFEPVSEQDKPLNLNTEIGPMLLDFQRIGDLTIPVFFEAKIENGVLAVPKELYRGIETNVASSID